MEYTVAIIGAGAGGMVAAITAAEHGYKVLLVERNDIPGKKILATGNGKCNLTNYHMDPDCFYSDAPDLVEKLLMEYPTERICDFFENIGVLLKEKNGYVYPNSEQAATVREMLACRLEEVGVTLVTSECIRQISKKDKNFVLQGERDTYTAKKVILACGGKASPKSGSDGMGYTLAKQMGHQISRCHPALVQLLAKEKYCKKLAGVRAIGEVSFEAKKREIAGKHFDRGEIQLTELGISGIPVFQISGYVNQELEEQEEVLVHVDFLPEYNGNQIKQIGEERIRKFQNRSVAMALSGIVNTKLMDVAISLQGVSPETKISAVPRDQILKILFLLKKMTFTITGSKGYDSAQVTRGGIPLTEVTDNLESRKVKGLYFCGELLNVDGICGGYNLHFAWAGGMKAGELKE